MGLVAGIEDRAPCSRINPGYLLKKIGPLGNLKNYRRVGEAALAAGLAGTGQGDARDQERHHLGDQEIHPDRPFH